MPNNTPQGGPYTGEYQCEKCDPGGALRVCCWGTGQLFCHQITKIPSAPAPWITPEPHQPPGGALPLPRSKISAHWGLQSRLEPSPVHLKRTSEPISCWQCICSSFHQWFSFSPSGAPGVERLSQGAPWHFRPHQVRLDVPRCALKCQGAP